MKRLIYIVITVFAITIAYSCNSPELNNGKGKITSNKYALGFEISKIEEGYILKVKNRIDESNNLTYDYLLSSSTESASSNNVIIHIPVSKIVCLSTTHCAFISVLEKNATIKGVSSPQYVNNDEIQKMYNSGEIHDIGYDKQINFEKILSINPDVVFAFGVDNTSSANFQKLSEAGIPVVFVNEFTEATPLGRTEWIKFFGCFYDKFDFASEYFDSIETNYLDIQNSITKNAIEPKVLVSLPWKGTWWVPGGNSFFANFVNDAGGDYLFGDNNSTESIPLSIEEVFSLAKAADFWLNPNDANSRKEILSVDSRISQFPPYEKAIIFNNNLRKNRYGGNDFWESGIIQPDKILSDLKNIFHPDSLKNNSLYYYKQLR